MTLLRKRPPFQFELGSLFIAIIGIAVGAWWISAVIRGQVAVVCGVLPFAFILAVAWFIEHWREP